MPRWSSATRFGVILAGSTAPEVARLRTALAGPEGVTVYADGFPRAEPKTAALLNGIAGRTPELCEGHRFASAQSAVQALPTVLALAEQRGASGQEALAALILGYDVAVRIGLATTPRPMAHQNGQWPMLGAVAAGARLRGLDAEQTSLALRIGALLVLTPSYANVAAGATALNAAGGMCGMVGQLAPELALAGLRGAARRDRGGLQRAGRRRLRAGAGRRGARPALGDHPQSAPTARLLHPDLQRARRPGGGVGRAEATPGADRPRSKWRPTSSPRS